MEADRFRELSEEFLLSGLEGEELRAFQDELERRGAEGREILRRTREAMGLLALSAPPVDPPAALRERLMAQVSAEAASGRSAAGDETRAAAPITGPEAVRDVRSPGETPETPAGTSFPWLRRTLLIAAIMTAVVLGVWNLNLQSDLADRTAALEEVQAELLAVDTLRAELAQLREDLGTIVAPTGSVFSLAGTETRPNARARVFVDPETGRALILAYELPILTAESVYQLWAIRDGEPLSIGTFTARDEGPARLELDSLDPVAGADLLAVTIEPAPGQPAPTGEMVLISGE